jgi:FkbM family methyltransferase
MTFDRSAMARGIILATGAVGSTRIARRPPVRWATRWASNHLVPWAARSAFRDGLHEVNGIVMDVPRPPDWGGGGEFHMALGTYERREMRFLLSRLRPGDVFVDVGAHVGYVTLPVARAVGPGGRVICLEPTPETFERLVANVERNGLGNVTAVRAAASDRDGEARLARSEHSVMWNSLAENGRDRQEGLLVATRSVDSVVEQAGWPPVAGLKIDAEGAEWSVLGGAERTLARNPGAFLMLEVDGGERSGESLRVLRHLGDRGYRFSRFTWSQLVPESMESMTGRLSAGRDAWANVLAERCER